MSKNRTVLLALPFAPGAAEVMNAQLQALNAMPGVDQAKPFIFHVPTIKPGSLDNLLDCSDLLAKQDSLGETVSSRLLTLLEDVSRRPRAEIALVQTAGDERPKSCFDFLTEFTWRDAQYPQDRPIKVLIALLHKQIQDADDQTRTKLQEYTEVKTKFTTLEKKSTGNINTRPIARDIEAWCRTSLRANKPIDTEHLCTLFVALPSKDKKIWEKEYPNLDGSQPGEGFVVPDSSETVITDGDLLLQSVVLFKSKADDFKARARAKKWITREYEPQNELSQEDLMKLKSDLTTMEGRLAGWLSSAFSETYSAWIHIKALRLEVEGMLRFGIPPKFMRIIVNVNSAQEKTLRKDLQQRYAFLETSYGADDTQDNNALELQYSYVSLVVPPIHTK